MEDSIQCPLHCLLIVETIYIETGPNKAPVLQPSKKQDQMWPQAYCFDVWIKQLFKITTVKRQQCETGG